MNIKKSCGIIGGMLTVCGLLTILPFDVDSIILTFFCLSTGIPLLIFGVSKDENLEDG